MKEFKVHTSGAELFVREYGLNKGQTIILIHGGPGITGTLTDLGNQIQDCARIIEYDQRGTAKSMSPGPFKIKNHLEDLRELIEKLCVDQKPILVGHSFGGFLGLCFSSIYGNLISKLIVISCAPLIQAAGREMDVRLIARFSEDELRQRELLLNIKADQNSSEATKDQADIEFMKLLFPKYQHNRTAPLHHLKPRNQLAVMEANKDYLEFRNSGTLLELLAQIPTRVFAFHGEADVIPPSGSLPILSEHVPSFEGFSLRESGHFPWHETNSEVEFLPRFRKVISDE